jgi:hypothetical protein
MQLRAVLTALVLASAVAAPTLHQSAAVATAPFESYGSYFQAVDQDTTTLQQIFDHSPAELPDVDGVVSHWRGPDGDIYRITQPSRVA